VGSLFLTAEETEDLDGILVGVAEPVRGAGVELGRFTGPHALVAGRLELGRAHPPALG
jgi:hypothetical protein